MCQERELRFHEQLQELAQESLQHPPQTIERQLALTRLISEIQHVGNLYCLECLLDGYSLPSNVERDIYQQALQQLWSFIIRNIDDYDPSEIDDIMLWVNQHFQNIFNDIVNTQIDNETTEDDEREEDVISPTDTQIYTDILTNIIVEYPDGILQEEHMSAHPEVNFQALALRRLAGESWEHIAENMGENFEISTDMLRIFYHQSLSEFRPYLRERLEE